MRDGVLVVETPDVLWGKLRQGVDLWNTFKRCRYAAREHYDVVHAVDCRPNVIIPALFIQHSQKIPFVLSWWDLFGSDSKRFGRLYALTAGKLEGWLETSFRKYADGATTITSYLAHRLEQTGFPRENIIVQHLGCDTSAETLSYHEARSKHSFGEDENIFCFAGTIYESDFALLIASLDLLKARQIPYRLLWIGKHQIAPNVCANYHITHLGIVPTMAQVYEYFAASDACLLPMEVNAANAARWHSKVTDYLNAGSPVALTPVSDFPELFGKHDIGWVSASGSAEDYATILMKAVNDKPQRPQKSAATRAFMKQELDVMAIATRAIEFYQRFL